MIWILLGVLLVSSPSTAGEKLNKNAVFSGEKYETVTVPEGAVIGGYLLYWGITLDKFQKLNPGVSEKTLKAGQELKTPMFTERYETWLFGLKDKNDTLLWNNEQLTGELGTAKEEAQRNEGAWYILVAEFFTLVFVIIVLLARRARHKRRRSRVRYIFPRT